MDPLDIAIFVNGIMLAAFIARPVIRAMFEDQHKKK